MELPPILINPTPARPFAKGTLPPADPSARLTGMVTFEPVYSLGSTTSKPEKSVPLPGLLTFPRCAWNLSRIRVHRQISEQCSVDSADLEELRDLRLTCGRQIVMVERSILARGSRLLLELVTKASNNTLLIPDFSAATVESVYRRLSSIVLGDLPEWLMKGSPPPGEDFCRWNLEAIDADEMRFAVHYDIKAVINLLRKQFLQSLPNQKIFDLDRTHSLGLRETLIQNIVTHFSFGQNVVDIRAEQGGPTKRVVAFTDPEIYHDLWRMIFESRGADRRTSRLSASFIESFAASGLHPNVLECRRIAVFNFAEYTEVLENIRDPEERWKFSREHISTGSNTRLLADVGKYRKTGRKRTADDVDFRSREPRSVPDSSK